MKNCVKDVRLSQGITQTALANKVGISRQTLSSIEKNKYDPSSKTLILIAKALQKPIEEIFLVDL